MNQEIELIPLPISNCPPLMPWRAFADSIGMEKEHGVVRGWLDRGYVPAVTIGKRLMVNMVLLRKQLMERED